MARKPIKKSKPAKQASSRVKNRRLEARLTISSKPAVSRRKDKIAAGLLAIFLGMLGIHEFYLGRTGYGMAFLISTLVSFFLCVVLIGFLFLFIIAVIAFVEGIVLLCMDDANFDKKFN